MPKTPKRPRDMMQLAKLVGEIAKLPPGQGLLLQGADWQLIGLTSWFDCEPWRSVGAGLSE